MSLDHLREQYPLARQWGEPTVFVETTSVSGVEIHVAGIFVQNADGAAATGSAGDLVGFPLSRAYFELLERTAILAMSGTKDIALAVKNASGVERERVGPEVVEPTSDDPGRWRYSRSNGVAVGSSWHEACARAEWELVERDRILRSWYGEGSLVRTELLPASVPPPLNEVYSFEARLFEDSAHSNVAVAGVFAFPRREDAPLLYGFGARPMAKGAMAVAAGECMQRLGFLWGESIPCDRPVPSPTADFHQEFFLWPGAADRLRGWLEGEHKELGVELAGRASTPNQERRFVDMTPPELSSRLFVAKALADGEIPLVFGDGHPAVVGQLPDLLRVHPVS
jgi:hypothetical protein